MLFSHLRASLFNLIDAVSDEDGDHWLANANTDSQNRKSGGFITKPANAVGMASLVSMVDTNDECKRKLESLEVLMLQEKLKALSIDFKDGIGLVIQGVDAGGARGAGTATEGIAAQFALAELGMARVLVHGVAEATCVFASETTSFGVRLDRTNGEKLGLDVLDADDRKGLKVVAIRGDLSLDWNSTNPDLYIRSDDTIVEVNGVAGDSSDIVEECKKQEVLNIKVERKLKGVKAPPTWHEKVQDLKLLAGLRRLDVVILAGPLEASSEAVLRTAIDRLKPTVIATSSSQPELVEQAKAAGCKVVDSQDLLLEQACICLAAWTGTPASTEAREALAGALLPPASISKSSDMQPTQ